MISRRKSKSSATPRGTDLDLLEAHVTNVVNIVILTGSIGSISAWLPSRRSTEHQIRPGRGTLFGQLRSRRLPLADPPCPGEGRNGRYFLEGHLRV